jgi:hypothetical protein
MSRHAALSPAWLHRPRRSAVVTGPTSGPHGSAAGPFTITCASADPGGAIVGLASSGSGDSFQATPSGPRSLAWTTPRFDIAPDRLIFTAT